MIDTIDVMNLYNGPKRTGLEDLLGSSTPGDACSRERATSLRTKGLAFLGLFRG